MRVQCRVKYCTPANVKVMSNSTHSDGIALDDLALAGPLLAIVVIIFVVLFAVVVVLVYKRNRQTRLRESAQLAARRLQTAIQLKQVNVERGRLGNSRGLLRHEKKYIEDQKQHLTRDNSPNIVPFNEASISRALMPLQADHNAASANSFTVREPSPNSSVLDDMSHVAVVNQDIAHDVSSPYDAGIWRGYMSGEMRFYYNTDNNRRYTGVHDMGNGYSSSEVDGWV